MTFALFDAFSNLPYLNFQGITALKKVIYERNLLNKKIKSSKSDLEPLTTGVDKLSNSKKSHIQNSDGSSSPITCWASLDSVI